MQLQICSVATGELQPSEVKMHSSVVGKNTAAVLILKSAAKVRVGTNSAAKHPRFFSSYSPTGKPRKVRHRIFPPWF
jgi:hypothetical protein